VAGTLDLEWLALGADYGQKASMSLATKHALMLAVGARYRRMRSSMLSALERGREPAVDFLKRRGGRARRAHGLSVPVNARARELVWAVARAERVSSRALLRELLGDHARHGRAGLTVRGPGRNAPRRELVRVLVFTPAAPAAGGPGRRRFVGAPRRCQRSAMSANSL